MIASALFFFASAALVVGQNYGQASNINFNCPQVTDWIVNATYPQGIGCAPIVRLRPCFQNKALLAPCSNCGQYSVGLVDTTINGVDPNIGNWAIITTSSVKPGDGLPQGYVRLVSQAPGEFNGAFLYSTTLNVTYNNMVGHDPAANSYLEATDSADVAIWQYQLRTDNRVCRVVLNNKYANLKLGVMTSNGPPNVNNLYHPMIIWPPTQPGASTRTEETWEVEFVSYMCPQPSTPVAAAGVAAAVTQAVATVVSIASTTTITSTTTTTSTTASTSTTDDGYGTTPTDDGYGTTTSTTTTDDGYGTTTSTDDGYGTTTTTTSTDDGYGTAPTTDPGYN